jgi:hypothetical protein
MEFVLRCIVCSAVYVFILADRQKRNSEMDRFFSTGRIQSAADLHSPRYHLLYGGHCWDQFISAQFTIWLAGVDMVPGICSWCNGNCRIFKQIEIEIAFVVRIFLSKFFLTINMIAA